MTRKQVDFSFRVFELNPTNPAQTSEATSAYIRETYLDKGWEVLSTAVPQVSAGSVFMAITLVKYENLEWENVVSGSDITSKKAK